MARILLCKRGEVRIKVLFGLIITREKISSDIGNLPAIKLPYLDGMIPFMLRKSRKMLFCGSHPKTRTCSSHSMM